MTKKDFSLKVKRAILMWQDQKREIENVRKETRSSLYK